MESQTLREDIGNAFLVAFSTVQGIKNNHKPKDIRFMSLVTLKNRGNWDFLGKFVKIISGYLESLISKAIRYVSEDGYIKITAARGIKNNYNPKDIREMMLVMLKNGGNWDSLEFCKTYLQFFRD